MVANSDFIELSLAQGRIRGVRRQTIYDEPYFSFEGIPYAKPPLGEMRFRAPQPPDSWTGVRDCTDFSTKPVQKNPETGAIEGSEDCLYLNVYVRKLKSDKPLPVLVWIYGGGFYKGEATRLLYSPDYFMFKDVVVVTFNYRLCSLGFLSVADPAVGVPGNAGLKDQVLALRWIKRNIERFNGDSDNITVFGSSAGGVSAHCMNATAQTRDLFHKAILMSGTMLNNWAISRPTDYAYRLAKANGYTGENVDEKVVDFLRGLEPGQLVAHNILDAEEQRDGIYFAFGPVVEPYISEDCVIPEEPAEMLKTAWGNAIPVMITGVVDEGLLLYPIMKSPKFMDSFKTDPLPVLPRAVRAAHNFEINLKLSRKMVETYFGDREPSAECISEFCELFGQRDFWHGYHCSLLMRLTHAGRAPTYLYRFAFDSPTFNHRRKQLCGEDITKGVAHADDMSYLWYAGHSWKLDRSTAEFKTIERLVGIITAFAHNSDPNCREIEPIQWPAVDQAEPHSALNISRDLKLMVLPEKERLQMWDSVYKTKNSL